MKRKEDKTMEGYYTTYSFVVIEYDDEFDLYGNYKPYEREFVSLEEAEEYYGCPITVRSYY
jgi:hypothetical protein